MLKKSILITFLFGITLLVANPLGDLEINGAVEFETEILQTEKNKENTISNANIELGIESRLSNQISSGFVFLYNEDDNLTIDTAHLTFSERKIFPEISLSRDAVFFGSFETAFLTDPFCLELGETASTMVNFSKNLSFLNIQTSLFNGKSTIADEDNNLVDSYAISTTVEKSFDKFAINTGFSFLNNGLEAGFFESALEEIALKEKNASYDFWLDFSIANLYFNAEYFSFLEEISSEILVEETSFKKIKPQAYNFEFSYQINRKIGTATRFEKTENLENLLPKTRYGLTVSWLVTENKNSEFTIGSDFLLSSFQNEDELQLIMNMSYAF